MNRVLLIIFLKLIVLIDLFIMNEHGNIICAMRSFIDKIKIMSIFWFKKQIDDN